MSNNIFNRLFNFKKEIKEVTVEESNESTLLKNRFRFDDFVKIKNKIYLTKKDLYDLKNAIEFATGSDFKNRYNLLQIYNVITQDPYLQGLLRQRKLTLNSCNFNFYDKNNNEIKEYSEMFNTIWFKQFIEYCFDSIFWGFSFIEIDEIENNAIKSISLIPREYCSPDYNLISSNFNRTYYSKPDDNVFTDAVSLENEMVKPWVVSIYKSKNDLGLFKELAQLIIPKAVNENNMNQFSERYGAPYITISTNTRDGVELDNLQNMLQNFGSNAYAILKPETEVNLLTTQQKGEIYKQISNYYNEQIAISVLGQTLTSQSQTNGTEALGKIHASILANIIESDMQYLEDIVNNNLLHVLKYHNIVSDDVYCFKVSAREELNITKLLENVNKLNTMGYEVDEEWLTNKLNIPIKKKINNNVTENETNIE